MTNEQLRLAIIDRMINRRDGRHDRRRFTDQQVKDFFASGKATPKQAAELFGCTVSTIYLHCRMLGIPIRRFKPRKTATRFTYDDIIWPIVSALKELKRPALRPRQQRQEEKVNPVHINNDDPLLARLKKIHGKKSEEAFDVGKTG